MKEEITKILEKNKVIGDTTDELIFYINKLLGETRENLVKETREYLKVYLDAKLMCMCEDCNKHRDIIKTGFMKILGK